MYGVTQRVWEEWVGHPVDDKTMRKLTPQMVKPLYKRKYWDAVHGDELPLGVDYCVFDAAVNSGPGRAIKWLQASVGSIQDGDIGPKTLLAINSSDDKQTIIQISTMRLKFLQSLATWKTFGNGWERRINEVRRSALMMSA